MPDRIPSHRPGLSADAARGSPHARGYGRRWRRLRLMVLREEPCCRLCGREATQVDHVIAREKGGTDARENLRALCASCHSKKTVEQDHGLGRPRRAT